MAKAQTVDEQDETSEFDEAAAGDAVVSGYMSTRDRDVKDQRDYTIIPKGTACTFGIQGFSLEKATDKRKAAIVCKVEVNAPEDYADGSSNFRRRYSLNSVVAPGNTYSGWDMTSDELCLMYAAVTQQFVNDARQDLFGPVWEQFPNMTADDVPEWQEAIVSRLNEVMKGETFESSSVDIEFGQPNGRTRPDGEPDKYPDKQKFGKFVYPKPEKK